MTRQHKEIGWYFPPTNGGREDGFKDPGIAHFSGLPLSSLARETIQNSLDARKSDSDPVHISFELSQLKPDDIGGNELIDVIKSCIKTAKQCGDEYAKNQLRKAQDILRKNYIPCLSISDQNTTGLLETNWHTLIKMQGLSQKPGVEGAGGSYGIGKYAPFAVSTLRTVFYWTYYELKSGMNSDIHGEEFFQGKSVLMSHETDGDQITQGTGFYGIKENCEKVKDGIPQCFRMLSRNGNPICGTKLFITGFSLVQDWRNRIASSVISNYFYVIANGKLKVIIDPDETEDDLFEINDSSIEKWFGRLENNLDFVDDEDVYALSRSRHYWNLLKGGCEPIEKQDKDLGHCKLWIRVAEGLPSRVALIRGTGMLVTDRQEKLLRFPLFREFVAVCSFEDPEGNELLRGMENPQHDKFEPHRLPEGEQREKGRKALKRITDWIRAEIRKKAGPSNESKSTNLSELANYLPDLYADESFDDSDGNNPDSKDREPGFGERVTVSLRPIRRSAPPALLPSDSVDVHDGYGLDTGNTGGGGVEDEGGGGGRTGPGEGEGHGGSGTRGGGRGRTLFPVSRIRILPIMESDNCYRLVFYPERSGTIRLQLEEAGDSSSIQRDDIRVSSGADSLNELSVVEGVRSELENNGR